MSLIFFARCRTDKIEAETFRRLRPYSPTVMDANGFELVVKIYADRQGVSAYLGTLEVGAYAHAPRGVFSSIMLRSTPWPRFPRFVPRTTTTMRDESR